jgi:hypothetical protein
MFPCRDDAERTYRQWDKGKARKAPRLFGQPTSDFLDYPLSIRPWLAVIAGLAISLSPCGDTH